VSARRVPVKKHPGIYRRGGRYSYTYTDPMGRQRYGSAATLAEAVKEKAAKTADVARGEFRETSKVTVADYAASFLPTYTGRAGRGVNADTLADYAKQLDRFVAYAGRMRMCEVDPETIRSYAAKEARAGLARNTVRLRLAPVRIMFRQAVEDGVLRFNPAVVRLTVGASCGEETKALTREQLDALFDELPARWLPFLEFLAEYGLRIGEAIELRWKDVETHDLGGMLHVRRRFYRGRVAAPKAGSARKLRLEASRARALEDARGEVDALVFANDDGSRIDASNLMARVLKPAAVRAGVGQWVETPKGKRAETWVGFHSFRHTCATLAIREAGWSLEQVQVFLGHSSRMTTDRYYAHLVSTDAPAPPPVRRSADAADLTGAAAGAYVGERGR
jgi:integrase